jgi:hypothetical protein
MRKYSIAEVAEKTAETPKQGYIQGPLDWSRIFSCSLRISSATSALNGIVRE